MMMAIWSELLVIASYDLLLDNTIAAQHHSGNSYSKDNCSNGSDDGDVENDACSNC